MPVRGSDKCRQCSKLSLLQALEKHGSLGDGCWERTPCNKRRTYYRGAIGTIAVAVSSMWEIKNQHKN